MLRKLLTVAAAIAGVAVVSGGVAYLFFGLRVVMDGGGSPHLRFVETAEQQAARVERHRAAQRAQAPPPAPSAEATTNVEAGLPPSPGASADHRSLGGGGQTRLTGTDTATANASTTTTADPQPRLSRLPRPYWTDFRGPKRDGEYTESPILVNWPAGGLEPMLVRNLAELAAFDLRVAR